MWQNHEYWCECTWQRTVSTDQLNSHNTSDRIDSQASSDIGGETCWASFQATRLFHSLTVSQCDPFSGCYMYLLFKTSPGWLLGWRFFSGGGGGGHWAPMSIYWSPGRRGYFGVSNVALVTHCGRDNMAAISQTTLSNAFSWMKMLEFRTKSHRSLLNKSSLVYWRIYASSLSLNDTVP